MKKFLALAMAIVMMFGMLAACATPQEDNAQALFEKANASLAQAPYAITIKMNFESDNDTMNQIFSLMNMEIPTTVNGNNIAIDMSMDLMGSPVGIKMIVADMVLYYNMELFGQSAKMKATLTEEQFQEFMEENNTEMTIMPEDFAEQTVETRDGKKYIVCAGISEEALEELNAMIAGSLDSMDAEGAVNEVIYNVTLNDGKYEAMNMTCVYSVTVDGNVYNVSLNMSADYSYDNIEEVTAPADADAYEEINFDELMA